MYKVIETFTDLQDGNYKYKVGDVFPHQGAKVSESRIAYLSSKKTKRGKPVIEKVTEKVVEESQVEESVEEEPTEKPKQASKKRSNKK